MSDQQRLAEDAADQLKGLSLQASKLQDGPQNAADTEGTMNDSTSASTGGQLPWQAMTRQAKTCADSLRTGMLALSGTDDYSTFFWC